MTIYNLLGQVVETLIDNVEPAGTHQVTWIASRLASGVYFYRMQVRPLDSAIGRDSKSGAGEFVQTRKSVLVR
jgi:hypothetical protein